MLLQSLKAGLFAFFQSYRHIPCVAPDESANVFVYKNCCLLSGKKTHVPKIHARAQKLTFGCGLWEKSVIFDHENGIVFTWEIKFVDYKNWFFMSRNKWFQLGGNMVSPSMAIESQRLCNLHVINIIQKVKNQNKKIY